MLYPPVANLFVSINRFSLTHKVINGIHNPFNNQLTIRTDWGAQKCFRNTIRYHWNELCTPGMKFVNNPINLHVRVPSCREFQDQLMEK